MSVGKGAVAITLSDTVDITKDGEGNFPDAVRFGTGGTAKVTCADGSTVTFTNISNGETIACAVRRVWSTGSSGIADVVGLYI